MEQFGAELWLSDGPIVTGAAGFRFPTRMAVIRLPNEGGLWVWSPVALTQDQRHAVDALGPVRHIIAPNSLHHTYLADWATGYPDAVVHAAPGLEEQIAGTSIHSTLGDPPDPAWANTIEQVIVPGNRITTEVVFFHRPSATVLVTDLVQQIPQGWYRGWRAVVARLDLMTAPVPSVPRKFRMATTDKTASRDAVRRILEWPAERLVMAHGAPLGSGGQQALRHAFRWLMP
ncbi:DUF4336 domain-containing protein [Pseudosulfitobacter pseudonitzschiae]|uniref:DUF4336 domain-containing protein n=1 Tax=Pseudosulfitobacter pseudonitzschiae TaxID=1402135 RepID=UPI002966369C|nr:DUF4336 domain-containing protein [Pseudosulfitobacter pseudonitzschiae]